MKDTVALLQRAGFQASDEGRLRYQGGDGTINIREWTVQITDNGQWQTVSCQFSINLDPVKRKIEQGIQRLLLGQEVLVDLVSGAQSGLWILTDFGVPPKEEEILRQWRSPSQAFTTQRTLAGFLVRFSTKDHYCCLVFSDFFTLGLGAQPVFPELMAIAQDAIGTAIEASASSIHERRIDWLKLCSNTLNLGDEDRFTLERSALDPLPVKVLTAAAKSEVTFSIEKKPKPSTEPHPTLEVMEDRELKPLFSSLDQAILDQNWMEARHLCLNDCNQTTPAGLRRSALIVVTEAWISQNQGLSQAIAAAHQGEPHNPLFLSMGIKAAQPGLERIQQTSALGAFLASSIPGFEGSAVAGMTLVETLFTDWLSLDPKQACRCLKRILERFPKSYVHALELSKLYQEFDDPENAQASLDQALASIPQDWFELRQVLQGDPEKPAIPPSTAPENIDNAILGAFDSIQKPTFENTELHSLTKDWRNTVKKLLYNPGMTQKLANTAFTKRLEKHVALQCFALISGEFDGLEAWQPKVWQDPTAIDYPLTNHLRAVNWANDALVDSPLSQVTQRLARTMINVFHEHFTAVRIPAKTELTRNDIEDRKKELLWNDPFFTTIGLSPFNSYLESMGFRAYDLKGIGAQLFFDYPSQSLFLDTRYYRSKPSCFAFHRILIVLKAITTGYYPVLYLSPKTHILPLINMARDSLSKYPHKALSLNMLKGLGGRSSKVDHYLRDSDKVRLANHFNHLGKITITQLKDLQYALWLHLYSHHLADTLDLIGLFGSISNQDYASQPPAPGQIQNESKFIEPLLARAADLQLDTNQQLVEDL